MQYVGQTKRKLKERLREHFNKMKNPKQIRVSSWMENPYGKSIWIFFSKILFFLICFNTYEL